MYFTSVFPVYNSTKFFSRKCLLHIKKNRRKNLLHSYIEANVSFSNI